MISNIPNDPMLCLSVINTKLRDFYPNIDSLCQDLNIDKDSLIAKLNTIDYVYDPVKNQFV